MLTALALLFTEDEKAELREWWVSELVSLAASKLGTVRMVWTIFWVPRGDGEGLLVDWILVFPSKRVLMLTLRAAPVVDVAKLRLDCGPFNGVVVVVVVAAEEGFAEDALRVSMVRGEVSQGEFSPEICVSPSLSGRRR